MSLTRLFEHTPAPKRRGTTTALVLVGTDRCPACTGPVAAEHREELPLLRHGGYGASRSTTRLHCQDLTTCGWSLDTAIAEHRPPRQANSMTSTGETKTHENRNTPTADRSQTINNAYRQSTEKDLASIARPSPYQLVRGSAASRQQAGTAQLERVLAGIGCLLAASPQAEGVCAGQRTMRAESLARFTRNPPAECLLEGGGGLRALTPHVPGAPRSWVGCRSLAWRVFVRSPKRWA